MRSANSQHYNYNNSAGNNCTTSNNAGQSNVTKAAVRRTSPTICQHSPAVTAASPVPTSSSTPTHTTLVDTGISGQGIANSIISGPAGGMKYENT